MGTRRHIALAGIVWFCFLMKLVFYAGFVPLWEGYDEFAHFAYVQHLAEAHTLPDLRNAATSEEVAESLRLAPVPWTIRQWTPGGITHDDFWRLPAGLREQRARDLKKIPVELARNFAPDLRLYEAQQPPLAYLLYAIPYMAFHGASLLTRAWVIRLTGCAMASFVIPLGFLVALRIFGNAAQAVGVVAVVASMPELMMTADHGGNEPLAIVLGTACVCVFCRLTDNSHRPILRALFLGCLLGCGLLTKAYFLTMIPAVAGVFAVLLWRNPASRRQLARQLIVTAAAALAIAGWWYARALFVTGTLTGSQIAIAAQRSAVPLPRAVAGIGWVRVADFALSSHIWLGGWSFLVLRTWMYRIIELILLAACASLILRVAKKRILFPLGVCIAVQLCFWGGLVYFACSTWLATGEAAVFGYYAYALAVPEAVCLVAGFSARRFVAPALVICFAAIEVYGTVFCLMPYYAGFTAHTVRGSVPAMQASALVNGGMAELFRNLAVNKPDFLSADILFALWVGFLLAIAGVVAVTLLLTFSKRSEARPRAADGFVPLRSR